MISCTGKVVVSEDAANEDLRGKRSKCELEVLDVKQTYELPELTEELLGELGFEDGRRALREAVRKSSSVNLTYHQQRSIRQQITSLLTASGRLGAAARVASPPEPSRELERAVLELRSSGFDENDDSGLSATRLRQNSLQSLDSQRALKEHFIFERIAEDDEAWKQSDEDFRRRDFA